MRVTYFLVKDKDTPAIAALNRISLFIKGLREQNHCVDLCLLEYSKKNALITLWSYISIFFSLMRVRISKRNSDKFIFYGEVPSFYYILLFLSHKNVYWEKTEYPLSLILKNNVEEKEHNSKIKVRGFITCTKSLRKYYDKVSNRFLILPTIIDFRKFENNRKQDSIYLTYCGDFGNNKDGVPILLKSFAKIHTKYPNLILKLIGDTNDKSALNEIYRIIDDCCLTDSVLLTGRVDHSLIPALLSDSKVLLLARPMNKQAEGGFPSKLVEYLATGIPVLSTNVGEISYYFEDQKDIYYAIPNSVEDFSLKLNFILENYDLALNVALNGKKKAKVFHYSNQVNLLVDFLKE